MIAPLSKPNNLFLRNAVMKNKDQVVNKDLDTANVTGTSADNNGTIAPINGGDNKDLKLEGVQSMGDQLINEVVGMEGKDAEALTDRIKAQFPTPDFEFIPLLKNHGDNMLGEYNNAAAAALGVAVAVGLELISPTGTKTSAAVAAIAGGTAIALGARAHTNMPQNTLTMGVSSLIGFKVAKGFGRLTVEYFPATKETEEVSDPAITFTEVLPAI
jgi:hypothetical protein